EEELRHIDLYVLLQNMRFDDKIDFIIDVPDEIMEYSIPKLVLQPVIENALLHGILEKVTREGTVVVMAWEEYNGKTRQEDIVFTISDDGVGMSEEKLRQLNESLNNAEKRIKSEKIRESDESNMRGSGIAITNTHLRLVLLYGHGYGLTFRSEEGKGTEVEVRIPKKI
ncbi:MAG TPA: sensor histidine kinase, partial [Lachnospiraceae bacterium]|nr:sensor histidine kinase [Lachnospiraceae bacterium]